MKIRSLQPKLASWVHLAILLLLLSALTAIGVRSQHLAAVANSIHPSSNQLAEHSKAIPFYISALVVDWALFFYCYVGVRWNGGTLATLTGERWTTPKKLLTDILIAAIFWGVFEGAAYGTRFILDHFFAETKAAGIEALLPRSLIEVILWIVLCSSAGICEEVIYRGYLQKQFLALTGSAAIAIILQGIVFGISHGYQGWKSVIAISFLGILFGLLAAWRGNLRANILAHAWSDTWDGWLQFLILK